MYWQFTEHHIQIKSRTTVRVSTFGNKYPKWLKSLGTNKASQAMVLNEDSVVVTQQNLMLTAWSSSSNLIWLRWETYTLNVVFVEHHTHFYVYVSQRSQVQFEDDDHAIYMSFCWVTTTCLRWEPQPVTLWLYLVKEREHVQFMQHLYYCKHNHF